MKVVVLAGPESSGKSWLAAELKEHFDGAMVGEYVRYFIEKHQRDTSLADIPTIAHGQLSWEDAARSERPRLLVLDTHLLTNRLWSQTLFGDYPEWLESEVLDRHYDLHLLLSPEGVEWTADGQRCQPELVDRQTFFQRSLDWMQQHHQVVLVVRGNWEERMRATSAAVDRLLKH